MKKTVRLADFLRSILSSGRPLELGHERDPLYTFLDGETAKGLASLFQDYPATPEIIIRRRPHHLSPFIWSQAHIRSIRKFLRPVCLSDRG